MKNKIYFLGIITIIAISVGCLFKINHWPGANIFLSLGFIIAGFVFIPVALTSSFRNENNKKLKLFYILTAIVLAAEFISALFKIMHWPYANQLIIITIPLPFVVLLPLYLYLNRVEKEINYRNFMPVIFFFAYFAAITSLSSISVTREVVDEYLNTTYAYEKKTAELSYEIKILSEEAQKDSTLNMTEKKLILDIQNQITVIDSKIEVIKKQLVVEYAGNPHEVIDNGKINYAGIRMLNSQIKVDYYYEQELFREMEKLKYLLSKAEPSDSGSKSFIENLIQDWSRDAFYALFKQKILISSLEALNMLKYQVRMTQFAVLSR